MYLTNKQLKAYARENLLGHYSAVIAVLFVSLLFMVVVNIPFFNMLTQGATYGSIMRIVVGILGLLIVSMVSYLIMAGNMWIHLRLAHRQPAHFVDMIYPFRNQPGRYFGYFLLLLGMAIVCILPGYLCLVMSMAISEDPVGLVVTNFVLLVIGTALLIAGIIIIVVVLLSWSMATFRLLENTNLSMMDSIRESRRILRGRRRRLFLLMLSFIGWIALSVLSFGIGLIWTVPYLMQAVTCLYMDLLPDEEGFR